MLRKMYCLFNTISFLVFLATTYHVTIPDISVPHYSRMTFSWELGFQQNAVNFFYSEYPAYYLYSYLIAASLYYEQCLSPLARHTGVIAEHLEQKTETTEQHHRKSFLPEAIKL